jgi:hypothetical protein
MSTGVAEAGADPELEPLEVANRVDLLPEPARHLRRERRPLARHEVEGGVRLLPELEPVTVLVPGRHALRVHPEGDGLEPLDGWLLVRPVGRGAREGLDRSLGGRLEGVEGLDDLVGREDLDLESAAARLLDQLRQALGRALQHLERGGPGGGQAPLDLGLRDDARRSRDAGGHACHRRATGL